jgi:hypothetical protein
MTRFAREEYVALQSPLRNQSGLSSPHSFNDSEESLRALELEEGPAQATPSEYGRSVIYPTPRVLLFSH